MPCILGSHKVPRNQAETKPLDRKHPNVQSFNFKNLITVVLATEILHKYSTHQYCDVRRNLFL